MIRNPNNDISQTNDVEDNKTESSGEIAKCWYCGSIVPINEKDHYRIGCPVLNAVWDPGGDNSYSSLTPRAFRSAAMTKVRLLTGTPVQKVV